MANPTSHKLVFFGTDAFSVPPLVRLLAEGWNIVGVVTKPDTRTGRGRELTSPAVKRLAIAKNIPVLQPHRVHDCFDELEALGAEAGIVVAYGRIIPSTILELFPRGLINVHASLLPAYRGASPIESALLAGDSETGVTLMQIDAGLDTGPTYGTAKLQLAGHETRQDLYEQLAELGADLLDTKLAAILQGNHLPVPQDNLRASTVGRISKADGIIDWHKPATQLEREIRAYLGWPSSRTKIAATELTVLAAHISPASGPAGTAYKAPSGELAVYTGEGSLILDHVKPAGKREMTGLAFLTGHRL